ncbi:MAG: ribosomal protein L7/L12 [Candidatus Solibacter usitatus]|nr:ribosomal protein L7/L12 [Candidatus Solibacter usitatus]
MPTKYVCLGCPLTFEVGWFHHIFRNGYASKTLLVCVSCGTQHAVENAVSDRGPESFQYFTAYLTAAPPAARVQVMVCLRHHFRLDLAGAREALKALPYRIGSDLSREGAEALAAPYRAAGATVEIVLIRESPNPEYGPVQSDRLLVRDAPPPDGGLWRELAVAGANASLDLERQACGNCRKTGVLVSEWTDGRSCPACGGVIQGQGTWMT